MSKPSSKSTSDEDPILFYMANAEHGELCQWYICNFQVPISQISTLIGHPISHSPFDDTDEIITFTSAEQFMMYCKAALFHDTASMTYILSTTSPRAQKARGKIISNFSDERWDLIKSQVVEAGNLAKFGAEENRAIRERLLATGERVLAEAASKDRVWGIGFNKNKARGQEARWGENRLGKALMVVRTELRRREAVMMEEQPWRKYS